MKTITPTLKIGDAVARVGGNMIGLVLSVVPYSGTDYGSATQQAKVLWTNGRVSDLTNQQLERRP